MQHREITLSYLNMLLNNIFKFVLLFAFASLAQAGNIVDDARQSIQLDDVSGVKDDLLRGLDVNFIDEDGNSLLMLAAKEGSTKSAALLLGAGARIHLNNAVGDSALLLATFWGHEGMRKIFRQLGKIQVAMGIDEHENGALGKRHYIGQTRNYIVCVGRVDFKEPPSKPSILLRAALPLSLAANSTPMPWVLPPCAPAGVIHTTRPATGNLLGSVMSVSNMNTSSPIR